MAKSELKVGAKWGHLEVIQEGVERKRTDLGGGCSVTENVMVHDVKCTCGKVVRIWRDEWKGRRHFKDCGCGVSADDGAIVVMSVSMPLRIRGLIRKYADENRVSVSRAVRELVEMGAAQMQLKE